MLGEILGREREENYFKNVFVVPGLCSWLSDSWFQLRS